MRKDSLKTLTLVELLIPIMTRTLMISKKSGGDDDQGGDATGMEVDQQNEKAAVVEKADSYQRPQTGAG